MPISTEQKEQLRLKEMSLFLPNYGYEVGKIPTLFTKNPQGNTNFHTTFYWLSIQKLLRNFKKARNFNLVMVLL